MTVLIVTRHEGAKKWLLTKYNNVRIVDHFDIAMLGSVDLVVGVLPVQLIYEVNKRGIPFEALVLPNIAYSERGKTLSPKEMDDAGAKTLRVWVVTEDELFPSSDVLADCWTFNRCFD